MGDKITVKQNWCLTADRSRVVPETSEEARWLYWPAGTEVDLEEAIRLGAVHKKAPPAKKVVQRSHHKKPAANKMADPPDNKEGW